MILLFFLVPECKDIIFLATKVSDQTGNLDPVVFEREVTNPGGHYSSTTGQFTAPCNGVYELSAHVQFSGHVTLDLVVDGQSAGVQSEGFANGNTRYTAFTVLQKLTAGQTVHIQAVSTDDGAGISGSDSFRSSYFSGHLRKV